MPAETPRTPPPALLEELSRAARAIAEQPPSAAGPLWGAAHKLLLKAKVSPATAAALVVNRDAPGLSALVATLRGAPAASTPSDAARTDAPAGPAAIAHVSAIDPDTLKHAMRAFRKRLKLLRLDQESSLGVGPMSGGRTSDIDAIIPPREFPPEVWSALADAGELRRAGPGFYALASEA